MFGWTLAVARLKCPQCRKGDIYIKKNLFAIKDGHKMNKQCSHCELEFEPEPGYYYGAMYVSYMLNVAFFLPMFLVYAIWLKDMDLVDPLYYFAAIVITLLAFSPYFFRLSRALYLAFFVRYDKEKAKKLK
ncbi:MAG: DUF983 domain-containing protein [Cytophagaceae bacterium]